MNRKHFLSRLLPLASFQLASPMVMASSVAEPVIPPYLVAGDTVGIASPAGSITPEEITPAVERLKDWGFQVRVGDTIGKKDFSFGGTDEERAADFQRLLDDPAIRAILCARGGYGTVRIIDKLDFRSLVRHPKWIIGFSDITVLHSHLNRNCSIASIHSKMCNSFPDNWDLAEPVQRETIETIRQCLQGIQMSYHFPSGVFNKTGTGEGVLVGGNLKTLESLSASNSDLQTNGKILFVEDTGEYLYSVDRMFWNLRRSGKLAKLQGLVIGGFKTKKDDPGEEFGKTLENIVLEKISEYRYPVCFDFPVGHQRNNVALKCGVRHTISVQPQQCTLTEKK